MEDFNNEAGGLIAKAIAMYQRATSNSSLLKHSKVLTAAIPLVAIIGYLKLKDTHIFLFAFGILAISFTAYLLSNFLKKGDKVVKTANHILILTITLFLVFTISSFSAFIIMGKPAFFVPYFREVTNEKVTNEKTNESRQAIDLNDSDSAAVKNYKIKVDRSSPYTPYVLLIQNESDLNDTISQMDWWLFKSEIINKWSYDDMVNLIYKLKVDIPIFFDSTLCFQCHPTRSPNHIRWCFQSIYQKPQEIYNLWKDCFSPKELQIIRTIIAIKENPGLYKKQKMG